MKMALYWIVSCTWGVIMTIIGAIAALAMHITGHKPQIFGYNVYFVVGYGWGGVNFGAFFFVSRGSNYLQIKQHEAGHGLQNILLGPLMPFVVAIPSAVRCLIREYDYNGKKIAAGIITALISVVGVVVSVLGFVYGIVAIGVIGLILALYGGVLAIWLYKKEIPQYANGAYVDYDAIWFEGCATRWGQKFFKE